MKIGRFTNPIPLHLVFLDDPLYGNVLIWFIVRTIPSRVGPAGTEASIPFHEFLIIEEQVPVEVCRAMAKIINLGKIRKKKQEF